MNTAEVNNTFKLSECTDMGEVPAVNSSLSLFCLFLLQSHYKTTLFLLIQR